MSAATLTREDVARFAQMVLSARFHAHTLGHGQGATDAAYGRVYAHGRTGGADRADYDLGFRVGRFALFYKFPAWKARSLTHADAATAWADFRRSLDARPSDPE